MIKVDIPESEKELQARLAELGLMTSNTKKALVQATESHKTQMTKDGASYLTDHLCPVVNVFLEVVDEIESSKQEDAVVAALLHDSLEDDPALTSQMLSKTISSRALLWVKCLTRQPEYHGASDSRKLELTKEYMSELANRDKAVRLVKLSDRLVNLHLILRIGVQRPERLQRYITETTEFFIPLAQKTSHQFVGSIQAQLAIMKKLLSTY